jgi:hypothetical protein
MGASNGGPGIHAIGHLACTPAVAPQLPASCNSLSGGKTHTQLDLTFTGWIHHGVQCHTRGGRMDGSVGLLAGNIARCDPQRAAAAGTCSRVTERLVDGCTHRPAAGR